MCYVHMCWPESEQHSTLLLSVTAQRAAMNHADSRRPLPSPHNHRSPSSGKKRQKPIFPSGTNNLVLLNLLMLLLLFQAGCCFTLLSAPPRTTAVRAAGRSSGSSGRGSRRSSSSSSSSSTLQRQCSAAPFSSSILFSRPLLCSRDVGHPAAGLRRTLPRRHTPWCLATGEAVTHGDLMGSALETEV